jgi:AraC family transcriptional activator of tynA and feaB
MGADAGRGIAIGPFPSNTRRVLDIFPGVRLVAPSENPERARAASYSLGSGRAVVIEEVARVVERDVQAGDRASGTFKVLLQAQGVAQVAHRGQHAELGPGDLVLIDGAQAFRMEMAPGYRQIVFELPRDLIGRRSSSLFGRAGDALSASLPAHGALSQALQGIVQHAPALAAQQRSGLLEVVVGLLSSLLGAGEPADNEERRWLRARADLDANLADPELNAARLARLQGISRRRLDAIFAAHGQSAERLIWERRIERAAEDLSNPTLARRSLIDIALGWGFNSPSHFSRSFRRRFGESPSGFRARVRRAEPAS